MNPHPSSNAMTPPGRPTLALIARVPASPPFKRVPSFLGPRARSLPLARASSASSSSFKRTELDRTRPNSTAAPPRRDAIGRGARRVDERATDRLPSRRSTLDSRRRLASASRESRLTARRQSCTRARARLDRSRSRSMRVDRWNSIAIDEGWVDRSTFIGRVGFVSHRVRRSVGRSVDRSIGLDRSVDRSIGLDRSVSIFHRSVDRGRESSFAAAIERARARQRASR